MKFYLGAHHPNWLAEAAFPLFVSHRALGRYKTMPKACVPWALDSGGFSELSIEGEWKTTPETYVAAVRRYRDEIGMMEWAAPQDWMCEPHMLEKTGLSVAEHQKRTIANYIELTVIAPELPFIPVVQGWTFEDYLTCVESYADAGVDLTALPLVGVGSVCRRQSTPEGAMIFAGLRALGLRLHGFGVKLTGLATFGHLLESSDSMSWSYRARRVPPLPGHTHQNCANCLEFAARWRAEHLTELHLLEEPCPPTSNSAPVSAGSPSASSEQDGPRSGSSRTTTSAEGSSPITGPTFPNGETSPPSTSPNSPGSTWSVEESPANPSRPPGSRKRSTTRGGSGPMPPVLFGIFGPSGWRSRTSEIFSRLPAAERRKLSSGGFPASGMTRNGSCYRLPQSVPRIDGNGSSSWPTPTVADSRNTRNATADRSERSTAHSGTTLCDAIILWPTPTTADGSGGPGRSGRDGGDNLRTAVRDWPTPNSRDHKDCGPNVNWDNVASKSKLAGVAAGPLNPAWVSQLMGFPDGWVDIPPAPAKSNTTGKRRGRRPASPSAATSSEHSGMPSSPTSPNSSAAGS